MTNKQRFQQLMAKSKCTTQAAEELWKWYDFSTKKGVASF